MNKHRPVYNTSSNYYNNYQVNASTLYKSKHSTPIRTETDLKLNLISPVTQKLNETNSNLPSSNSNNKNTNSTNNSSHLAYIDADSQLDIENEEETYDNLPKKKQPPTQPQQKQQDQSNGMVKLQLLMLKSQPISRSSPVLLLNDQQKYHYHIHGNDYEEEHYIKINPLHLKLKQIKLEASSSSSLTSLPKNNVLVNSTESLEEEEEEEEEEDSTTNYDNDLAEILAKRQQQETQLALSSESESLVTTKKPLQNRTNINRILNEANSFGSLSSVALSSMSSMSGSINLQNETQNVYSMQVKTAAAHSTSTTTSSLAKNSYVNTNSSRGDYCLSLMNLTQKNIKQQAIVPQHNLVKKVQLKYPVTIQRRNTNIIEYNPQPAKNYYKQQQHQSPQHHKQQLHHRNQTHSRSTHRHLSFNLRRKTTGSIMGANGAPIYEDYLCDKEVESYFDNPVYFDCLKNSQKLLNFPINMHPPPPIISASLYSQHSVVTTDAPLNLLTKSNMHNNKSVVLHKAKCFNASNFLVKPNVVRNGSVSFSSLSLASSSSSSSSNTTSSNNSVTLTKSLIGAGIVRQNQGESYC
jgi:hypothetical protein